MLHSILSVLWKDPVMIPGRMGELVFQRSARGESLLRCIAFTFNTFRVMEGSSYDTRSNERACISAFCTRRITFTLQCLLAGQP